MKWMILLSILAISCTSHEKKAADPAAIGSPTESNASPYTVKPCHCMKIFQPVCAGGQNFGNSCEAECQGHTKWSEGACPEGSKSLKRR